MSEEKDSFVGKMDSQIHIILEKRINELEEKFYRDRKDVYERIEKLEASSASHTENLKENNEVIDALSAKSLIKHSHSSLNNELVALKKLYKELKTRIGTNWDLMKINTDELRELREHDVFRIWNSMRTGGKTTLKAFLYDVKNIEKVLRELIINFKDNYIDYNEAEFWDKLEKLLQRLSDATDKKLGGEKERNPIFNEDEIWNDENPSEQAGSARQTADVLRWDADGGDNPFKQGRRGGGTAILGFEDPIVVEKADLEWLFSNAVPFQYEGKKQKWRILKEKYLGEKS